MKKASNKINILNEETKAVEKPKDISQSASSNTVRKSMVNLNNPPSSLKLNNLTKPETNNKVELKPKSQQIIQKPVQIQNQKNSIIKISNKVSEPAIPQVRPNEQDQKLDQKVNIIGNKTITNAQINNTIITNPQKVQQLSQTTQPSQIKEQNGQQQQKLGSAISNLKSPQKIQSKSTIAQSESKSSIIKPSSTKTIQPKASDTKQKIVAQTKGISESGVKSVQKKKVASNNNEDLEEQKDSSQNEIAYNNKYKFLEVFNQKIIDKILLFLQLNDLAKFATLSKASRNNIPAIIKQQDFSKKCQQMQQKQYEQLNYISKDVLQTQRQYQKLINTQLPKLKQQIKDFPKKKNAEKDIIWDILHIGVNIMMKTMKKKEEIIDFILEKGVKTVFKDLEIGYLKPLLNKTKIPDFYNSSSENPFMNLIVLLQSHLKRQQENKYTQEQQNKSLIFMSRFLYYQQFQNLKEKFLIKYQRPIYCLKRTSNVFDYINKNNIQLIIPFLRDSDLLNLLPTNKRMNSLVKSGIQSIVERISTQRNHLLQQHSMTDKQASTVIYISHLKVFQILSEGYLSSHMFKYKPIREMIYTLCQVLLRNMEYAQHILEYKDQDYTQHYYLYHDLDKAQPEKLPLLEQVLSEYNDANVQEKKPKSDQYYYVQDKIIALQKYLKGVKLYLELNMNSQLYQELESNYFKNIYTFDCKMYRYEKLLGQNKEQLPIYIVNILGNKHNHARKIKGIARHLFRDNDF